MTASGAAVLQLCPEQVIVFTLGMGGWGLWGRGAASWTPQPAARAVSRGCHVGTRYREICDRGQDWSKS